MDVDPAKVGKVQALGSARNVRPGLQPHSRVRLVLIVVVALVVLLALPASKAGFAAPADSSGFVSVEAVSQDVRVILQQLAVAAGVNIVIDDTLTGKVTVRLKDVSFDQALQIVAKAVGATVAHDGGLYLVQSSRMSYIPPAPPPEQTLVQLFDLSQTDFPSALELIKTISRDLEVEPLPELKAVIVRGPYSQVNAVKMAVDGFLRGRPSEQGLARSIRVLRLSYADISEVAMSIQSQFPTVRVMPVRSGNSLVLSGPTADVESAVSAIRQLDRSPALISFEVEVVEVDSDSLSSSGIDWQNLQGQPLFSVVWKEVEQQPTAPGQPPGTASGLPFWVRSSLQIVTQIRLLESKGEAKVLARPSLTTLENRTARMNTGDRYIIVITQNSGGSTWQQIQYIDAGVRLELTPRLDEEGNIVVSLSPAVNAVTGFSREGFPVMSTREAQTTVRLKDGETLVIGGLIRNESSDGRSGLSGLSKLPIIGSLFSSSQKSSKRTELVILVTPRIVEGSTVIRAGTEIEEALASVREPIKIKTDEVSGK